MPEALISGPCPICGGRARARLFHQEFTGLSDGSLLTGYDVAVCRDCGYAGADPLPSPEAFERYYERMSKYESHGTAAAESPQDVQRFARYARLISEGLTVRETPILDVGCATGGLLAELKRRGYTRLKGLDPSPLCARITRERHGVETAAGTLRDLAHWDERFGLITLAAVLEHLAAPRETLALLHERLTPEGLLLVDVPDARRFTECLDAPYQQFSLEHIHFFSRASLTNLLYVSGYEPVRVEEDTTAQSLLSQMPVVTVLARRLEQPRPWQRDTETGAALAGYVAASRALEERIARQIAALAESRRPLLVWGVGTHTQHLLGTTRLREACIRAFVDSNARYHDKQLLGLPILAPAAVRGRTEAILISSCTMQEEIAQQIREELGLPNEVLRLYGRMKDEG